MQFSRISSARAGVSVAAACVFIASMTVCASGLQAQTKPKAEVAKCGGSNAVDALKTNHPELHREVVAEGAKVANTEAILWRIEKAGASPSHLFGTMHVSDPRIATLSERAKAALDDASTVALEIADMSPQAMSRGITKRPDLVVYMDGSRLDKKLAPQEYAVAAEVLAGAGLPAQVAPMIRPWFVYLLMAMPACETARIRSGKLVLDTLLMHEGKKRGIPVVGLETAIQQMEIIAGLSEKVQIEMLRSSLALADRREDMHETLIQLYQRRRIGQVVPLSRAMAKVSKLRQGGMKHFMKSVVVERNFGMRDNAIPLIEKGGAFVAVGALHLVGEKGLVALLRAKGYKVTAIE